MALTTQQQATLKPHLLSEPAPAAQPLNGYATYALASVLT